MKNCVVIPCYDRPEYLELCLSFIQMADGWKENDYIFAIDNGARNENIGVIANFTAANKYTVRPQKTITGVGKQSYNVLSGLVAAAHMNYELVHYIEDDVFIAQDFFTFTKKIHAKEPELFCSIMSKNVNGDDRVTINQDAYYVKHTNQYQGIGSTFKGEMIKKYITPHYCNEYFQRPSSYVQIWFESALSNEFCEQDGLIRRIIEKDNLPVAFAHVPRCFHAGFYGYHRNPHMRIPNNAEQKKKLIMEYSFSPEKLSKVVQSENLVTDSYPINLQTAHGECINIPL